MEMNEELAQFRLNMTLVLFAFQFAHEIKTTLTVDILAEFFLSVA